MGVCCPPGVGVVGSVTGVVETSVAGGVAASVSAPAGTSWPGDGDHGGAGVDDVRVGELDADADSLASLAPPNYMKSPSIAAIPTLLLLD